MLDTFGPERVELSLADIAEAAGVTRPSALRIGYTLVEGGYLVRNPATRGYRLGPRALTVGLGTLSAMSLAQIAEPYLAALRDDTDETVKLAIPSGLDIDVIAHLTSLSYPRMTNAPGKPMPVTVSSLGRAVLAWQPPATIDAVIAAVGPHRLTAKTIPHHRLRAELDDTRQRGYAVNDQGTTVEKRSVAAPVRGVSGRTIAAINISVPARRVSLDTLERVLAPRLLSTAATLSSTVPPGVRGAGSLTVRPR